MKTRLIRDPITHELLGTVLTTNPDLWECYAQEEPPREQHHESDDASWATLYGIEED